MASSLDSLAQNLPSDKFTLLELHFKDWFESSVQMLKQNGFFPYCNIDNFNKLKETTLPPREKWLKSLQQYRMSVTEDEYKHAFEVFENFQCETIKDYYSLYLKLMCSFYLKLNSASVKYATKHTYWIAVSTIPLPISLVMLC